MLYISTVLICQHLFDGVYFKLPAGENQKSNKLPGERGFMVSLENPAVETRIEPISFPGIHKNAYILFSILRT